MPKPKSRNTILRKARNFDVQSRKEYETWLDKHGPKFFAFDSPEEASRFLIDRIHDACEGFVCEAYDEPFEGGEES